MIREEILNVKLIITIIFISFACIFDLPDCTLTLIIATDKVLFSSEKC